MGFKQVVLSYTHKEKNMQEVINFIDAQEEVSTSTIIAYVLQRDYEQWKR